MPQYVVAPGSQVVIPGRGTLTEGMPIPDEWSAETIEANLTAGGIVATRDPAYLSGGSPADTPMPEIDVAPKKGKK